MRNRYGRTHKLHVYVYNVELPPKETWKTCRTCGKPLTPYYTVELGSEIKYVYNGTHGYEGNGHFCTQRCGYRWGLAVARKYLKED